MQAVGRISSYISKSVYNVSGTFHPFGGSVDIIVVEQPDGSFKSSPWYVRFGKFQGVLKSREKLVSISVNDVDADFHMYLDNRGEAYFLKEVDVDEGEPFCSPPTSSGEETDGQPEKVWPLNSKSCNYDSSLSDAVGTEKKSVDGNVAICYQRLGLSFGRKRSMGVKTIQGEAKACDISRADSLERAEIAANLLDLKWSTNLASSPSKKDNASRLSSVDYKVDASDTSNHDSCNHSESDVSVKETIFEMECLSSKVDSSVCVDNIRDRSISDSLESSCDKLNVFESECGLFSVGEVLEVQKSYFQIESSDEKVSRTCFSEDGAMGFIQYNCEVSDTPQFSLEGECGKTSNLQSIRNTLCSKNNETVGNLMDTQEQGVHSEVLLDGGEQEQSLSCNSDEIGFTYANDPKLNCCEVKAADATWCSMPSSEQSIIAGSIDDLYQDGRRLRHVQSDGYINKDDQVGCKDVLGTSLPTSGFVNNNLKASDFESNVAFRVYNDNISPGSQTVITKEELQEHKDVPVNSSIGIPENSPNDMSSFRGNTKRNFSFSFKRSKSKNVSHMENYASGNDNYMKSTNGVGFLESSKDRIKVHTRKRLVRTLIPTCEQLASLKLQQGKNLVTFSFSTAMLGKQQVDARIFLWRWDTRIVISDVDGTITRSDLLGQVMPLVGMDWSQSGVAHLFSAIKENGYQLLFLSARSIAQSFHTRQFLLNIKQDGKALPEGPVVISPDGLFPSLFREVIRRAPHEFKIACLEDIKALFPADMNPFYAGFGNRDTDEFSYLKVGIPKGKIFIINPKGKIVVNRLVDTKSYSSLHSLVHGMFPTMPSCEQEDFNTWNYWKLPTPLID